MDQLEEYLANFEEPSARTLANAGLDRNAQLGLQWGGDFSQVLDDSHLAPGTSPLAYGADAYAQSIRDRYDPQGLYVPAGEVLSGVGQGLTQMGTKALFQNIPADESVITDAIRKVYPDVFQYLSTAGGTAQRAREAGASDDQALLAGALSGGKGYLNKHFYGGIPGLKESTVDDMLFPLANTDQERVLMKGVSDTIGGGVRSMVNTEEDAFISKLWNGDDRGIGQTLWETLPQAGHSALINTATNNVLHPLDLVRNYQDAGIVDAAMDTIRNGGTLSDAQLAEAEAALLRLEGDGNNGWGHLPRDEWRDAKNTNSNK